MAILHSGGTASAVVLGASERMYLCQRYRCEQWLSSAVVLAATIALLACASGAQAGILVPQPVGFSEGDLEKSLTVKNADSASTSSSSDRKSQLPSQNSDDNSPNPLGLLKGHLPIGGNSSSGSSSSSAGGVGANMLVCSLNNTITIVKDPTLSRIAEDHGLSLPDPPGTDLLRPPRAF